MEQEPQQQTEQPKPEVTYSADSGGSSLKNKKAFMVLIPVMVLIASIPLGVYLVGQNQNPISEAIETAPPIPKDQPLPLQPGTSLEPSSDSLPSPQPPQDLKGDINGDGKVDGQDQAEISANLNKPASINPKLDLNGDQVINSVDLFEIKKLIVQ